MADGRLIAVGTGSDYRRLDQEWPSSGELKQTEDHVIEYLGRPYRLSH